MDGPRCPWADPADPVYLRYHDEEWGRPCADEQALFTLLLLEGAQAGLSWRTILHKRENYHRAFANFEPEAMARFTAADQTRLREDAGIVRNRLKIDAFITNARAYLQLREETGGLTPYLWDRFDGQPRQNQFATMAEVPATTPEAETLSRDLKKRGFRFVGPTIVYAFLQAAGFVNDHLTSCPWHAVCAEEATRRVPLGASQR